MDFGPPLHVDDDSVLNGEVITAFDPNTWTWDPSTHNFVEDPLFVGDNALYGGDDPLLFVGGYMLSQITAGQIIDSNCIDAGSDLASFFGLDTYTTMTNVELDDQRKV